MLAKEQLINIGLDGLADILLSLYQSKPEFQKELELAVASFDSDPTSIVSIIREDISSLETCNDIIPDYEPYNYYGSDGNGSNDLDKLVEEINGIRSHIMKYLLPKWPTQAIELLFSLLDTHENTLNRVEEDDEIVREAFQEVCCDLGAAHGNVTNSIEDIVKLVFDRFMNNNNGIFSDIIQNFKVVLGHKGLKLLKQKLQQSSNETSAMKIQEALKNIADFRKNVNDYIKACSFAGRARPEDHLEIAKRLIKHGRGEEAITWLDSMDQAAPDSCMQHLLTNKMSLKIKALNLCGNYDGAQSERQKWFGMSLSSKVYNEILEHTQENCIESWKNTAFQRALQFHNPLIAFNFFREIKEFEQVAILVCQKVDSLCMAEFENFRPVAEKLCNIDPLAATLLYRKMIIPRLQSARSNYYKYTAEDLASCLSLSSKITDWKGYENHQEYFAKISSEHNKKKRFWSEYASTLSKRQKCESA